MSDDEMKSIRELDVALLNENRRRIWMYFAEKDDWVGEEREVVIRAFDPDPGTIRVVHGERDIPHAFCISARYICLLELMRRLTCMACRPWGAVGGAVL